MFVASVYRGDGYQKNISCQHRVALSELLCSSVTYQRVEMTKGTEVQDESQHSTMGRNILSVGSSDSHTLALLKTQPSSPGIFKVPMKSLASF
jgi:hypothetical protein